MLLSEPFIDILRAAHLVCFAAGMGTGLYFDLRTLRTLGAPITQDDIDSLHAFHTWITAAFGGLWITGIALIYVRTGFVLEAFSPKLWAKLIVMSLMVVNAAAIGRVVFRLMDASIGQAVLALPFGKLALITQIAINSMFCWFAGMALGSSKVLKTAPWDVLIPLGLGSFVLMSLSGQAVVSILWLRSRSPKDPFRHLHSTE